MSLRAQRGNLFAFSSTRKEREEIASSFLLAMTWRVWEWDLFHPGSDLKLFLLHYALQAHHRLVKKIGD